MQELGLAAKLCATCVRLYRVPPWLQDEAEGEDKNMFLFVRNMFWDHCTRNLYPRS